MNTRRLIHLLAAAVLVSALVFVASATAVRQARKAAPPRVAEAQRLLGLDEGAGLRWKSPGPALKVGARLRGKTVLYVANSLSFPFTQSVLKGAREAGALLGLKVEAVDAQYDPSNATRLIQQGITRKVSVIAVMSFAYSTIPTALQAAKAAHIPVIEMFEGDPGPPVPAEANLGVAATATYDYSDVGRKIAHFIVADSKGKARILAVNAPDIGSTKWYLKAFRSEMQRLCPTCPITVKDSPVSNWQTGLQTLTSSSLKADPSINYLFPLFDSMSPIMKPAVTALNREHSIKIVSYNASVPNMQNLAKLTDPEVADVGGGLRWFGWGLVDQSARLLLGAKPVPNLNIPNRTFDHNNIRRIHVNQDESTWYCIDFRSHYKKLWGLKAPKHIHDKC